jgi:peptidoglycan/xylan/chitin deacetylase (PgdA/CDA1 family)
LRFDDFQDYWLNKVQVHCLQYHLDNSIPASLAVIAGMLQSDLSVINTIKEGVKKRLFEVVCHGFKHEDFSTLPYGEQVRLLSLSNERISGLFAVTPVTFTPPYYAFNTDTLRACEEVGYKYFASHISVDTPGKKNKLTHWPATVDTAYVENEKWILYPADKVIEELNASQDKYGYAVMTMHFAQFAKHLNAERQNEVDPERFAVYEEIMKWLKLHGYFRQIKTLGVECWYPGYFLERLCLLKRSS